LEQKYSVSGTNRDYRRNKNLGRGQIKRREQTNSPRNKSLLQKRMCSVMEQIESKYAAKLQNVENKNIETIEKMKQG
jgi:hypothetical protein